MLIERFMVRPDLLPRSHLSGAAPEYPLDENRNAALPREGYECVRITRGPGGLLLALTPEPQSTKAWKPRQYELGVRTTTRVVEDVDVLAAFFADL
jgi:hypothetical protein